MTTMNRMIRTIIPTKNVPAINLAPRIGRNPAIINLEMITSPHRQGKINNLIIKKL